MASRMVNMRETLGFFITNPANDKIKKHPFS